MNNDTKTENYVTVIRHTRPINISKPIDVCRHKSHGMFFKCSTYPHYHCISCGRILADDIILRTALRTAKIINYRYSCNRLCDHLST